MVTWPGTQLLSWGWGWGEEEKAGAGAGMQEERGRHFGCILPAPGSTSSPGSPQVPRLPEVPCLYLLCFYLFTVDSGLAELGDISDCLRTGTTTSHSISKIFRICCPFSFQ